MTLEEALARPAIPITDAGKLFFGLGRSAAYQAASSGDIPTIRIGKKIMVPVVPLAERLGLRATVGRAA
jgi:hypothetical protein